jgi:hypothetical protein
MRLDLDCVRTNVRKAATEELLDDATIYREGMEPAALDVIENELRERGVTRDAVAEHERKRRETALFDEYGVAVKCCKCRRPAVVEGGDWHRLWGLVPLFRRRFAWCAEHAPKR